MKLARRAFLATLALMMLCLTVSAQTLRSPNDPRNLSPTVGTGGPSGGPTGLFTIYDGSTLRRGEYTFSIAYSNYDRDPGNVDLAVIPGSFQVGLNDYVELFYNMDLYRSIQVNNPQNLSSFYLPNSQLRFGPGVLGSGPAIILAPTGPNGGSLQNTAVFRTPQCGAATGCTLNTNLFPAGAPAGYRFWGQPFVQFPYVGGTGPNFGAFPTAGGVVPLNSLFGFTTASTSLNNPRAGSNTGNFGTAGVFPGIGSPVGSILPGIVLATSVVVVPRPVADNANLVVPSTFTIAPTYLPDAPFLNRTYGESSFSQAVVGAKIRLSAPNSAYGFGFIPQYRFYLDKADDAAGFNQLQRGAGAGGDIGDFGLTGFLDARLSRSVNVSVNLGYWLNSNPKGQFPTGEFSLLDRPDELLAGIGFDFPVNKYFQPIVEVRSTQYVGGRTPNAFENSPVEALAGVKIYPRRWFGMGFAYRYMANQQDRDSFETRNANVRVNLVNTVVGGVAIAPAAVQVPATVGGFPRGFIPSDDPHGFIGQFWIGRRNSRVPDKPKNGPPTVKLEASTTSVKTAATCGEGQRPNPNCTPNAEVALRTSATDPDNDVLLYNYTTTGGRIVGEGTNVNWDLSGLQPGTYRANVYVKDGNGHEICDWVTVTVMPCDCVAVPIPTPPPPPPCATISVSGPSEIIQPGSPATVSANVSGAPGSVSYNWSVSCGSIISGQGSPTITVDTTACPGRPITATVVVGGLAPECPNTKSVSFEVAPRKIAVKVAEFLGTNFNKDKANLDPLGASLQSDPGSTGYIIAYGTCGTNGVKQAERQKKYIVDNRQIEASRIVIIDGGCRNAAEYELWVVPQGADAPAASNSTPCQPCKRTKGKKSRRGDDDDDDEEEEEEE